MRRACELWSAANCAVPAAISALRAPTSSDAKHSQEGHSLHDDHAQQPADVVAHRTQHRMQPAAGVALEVTAFHAVIGLQVPDDWLNGLPPLQLLSFLLVDAFALSPVHDVHILVLRVHAPIAQDHERRLWPGRAVLHQDRGLLQLPVQGVGARQGSCRFIPAASGCLSVWGVYDLMTESPPGLSVTASMGVQQAFIDQTTIIPPHLKIPNCCSKSMSGPASPGTLRA